MSSSQKYVRKNAYFEYAKIIFLKKVWKYIYLCRFLVFLCKPKESDTKEIFSKIYQKQI